MAGEPIVVSPVARYVAVVGPGEEASAADIANARIVGQLVAARGWVALTGGYDAGVMRAAADGATAHGGLCIGILPGSDRAQGASALTACLATGLGEARNVVLVNAADAVIACGMNPGTLSEAALAIRAGRPVALVGVDVDIAAILAAMGGAALVVADTAEQATRAIAAQFEQPR